MALNPMEMAERAAASMLEKKATDIRIIDLRGLSSIVDYFVIGAADSGPQVKAIVEQVKDDLETTQIIPWHTEGAKGWRWVLIDYVDIAVHVFRGETRAFYGLERLWGDAPTTVVTFDSETGQTIYSQEAVTRKEAVHEQG